MCVTQMFRFGSRKGSRKGLLGSDPPDHSYLAHARTASVQTCRPERDLGMLLIQVLGDTITSDGRRVRSLNVNF